MALGLFIRDAANVPREITELVIRDATNTPRTITELWIRDVNNTPRLVFNPTGSATFMVDSAPGLVSGASLGTGTCTTDTTTATATGGTAPYTYAWTLSSFTAGTPPTATSPSSNVTAFNQTAMDPGAVYSSQWVVTATDADSNQTTTEVTAIFVDNSA